MKKMIGKRLTKKQLNKIHRIEKLFKELKDCGVEPVVLEGGGNPTIHFFRDIDRDDLYNPDTQRFSNQFDWNDYKIDVVVDVLVP